MAQANRDGKTSHTPMQSVVRLCGLAWIILLGAVLQSSTAETDVDGSIEPSCNPGFYNVNCTGVCHCLNGIDQCEPVDGMCGDYQCERGWMRAPYCDEECADGSFGSECIKKCHCQPGISCLRANGACENNACHSEWAGSACQTRLPKLINPPVVVNVSCTSMAVTWAKWQADKDVGVNTVASYTVQMRSDSVAWRALDTVYNSPDLSVFNYTVDNLDNETAYEFRIVSNLADFGKILAGLPGPASAPHKPDCTVPTRAVASTTSVYVTTRTTAEPLSTRPPNQVPSAVLNVRQTRDSPATIVVEWDRPTDVGDLFVGYNFTYQATATGDCSGGDSGGGGGGGGQLGAAEYVALQPARTSYTFTLSALLAWTRYVFEIRAHNVHGQGASVRGQFTSPAKAPSGVVQNLRHDDIGTTEVTLLWDEVSCALRGGPLEHYDVIVRDVTRDIRFTQQHTSERRLHVDNLAPYWRYAVRVSYVNGEGAGPPSAEHILTTKQDVPAVPRSVLVKQSSDTTLDVSWLPPEPANGQLLEYRIVYWEERSPEVKHSTSLEATSDTTKQIGDLLPFTRYFIQVSARSEASINSGWGNASDPISHVTTDGEPGVTSSFNRTFRNESCVGVSWTEPRVKNGIISSYKVSYKQVDAESNEHSSDVSADQFRFSVCSLLPAALYRFGVRAKTRTAYGPITQLDIWTELGTPPKPASPKIVSHNDTVITISVKAVERRRGPISAYFVVVSALGNLSRRRRRRKRSLPDPVVFIPGLNGYTAAELTPDDLLANEMFTIGDGRQYGAYVNVPLDRDTDFLVAFVVASSLDGVVKMSMSQVLSSTKRRPSTPFVPPTSPPGPPPVVTTGQALTADDDDNTVMIIAVVIPLLLLLVIVLVIGACHFMKKREKKVQATEKRSAWLNYYTANFSDTTTPVAKPNKWSDIYELNASRVPVYTQAYSAADLKVSDIYHNKPQISFDEEYRKLPHGAQCASRVAEQRENQNKNRFEHLLAYDHSRVVLADVQPGSSDYVNASYVHGYECRNAYIAAQSPFNDVTICDFWQLVYQERVSQVVFLGQLEEDGVVKSERYWPAVGSQQYDGVMVSLVDTVPFASFVVRRFDILTDGKVIRRVTHYQFVGWPAHGVPDDPIPLLEFRERVRATAPAGDEAAPVLVHCGTGVSRSAVFIALDALLQQATVENVVNVFNFCNKMRRNRVMMVRTLKQYVFVYDLLFEALITTYNVLGVDLKLNYRQLSRLNPVSNASYFREQFATLERFIDPLPADKCATALRDTNAAKNRFCSIVAPDAHRPLLRGGGGLGAHADYINAVYVDGYRQAARFVVTQTPLEATVADFWQLVYDHNISTIVALNGGDFVEDSCAEYWPSGQTVQHTAPFFIKPTASDVTDHVTTRTAQLRDGQRPADPARAVRQLRFEAWRMYEKVPWSRDAFLRLIEQTTEAQEASAHRRAPILVHCMDGASQSGLFCACVVACEKMRAEQQVDVFHTIKHMKRRRPHFVNSLEQYKFCFKLLWDFLNTRMNILPIDINEPSSQWL